MTISSGKPLSTLRDYLQKLAVPGTHVVDVGTSARFAKELRPFENLFDGVCYEAFGYNPASKYGAYNCDGHQDVTAMTWPDAHVDGLICLEVLEHVTDPFQAAREIMRVLKPGGQLLLTVPFLTGYHGHGLHSPTPSHEEYPDFWRFTHEGLELLFRNMSFREVVPLDGPLEVRLQFLRVSRLLPRRLFRSLVDRFDAPRRGKATSRHLVYAIK